jgi:hypothetical protein
VSRPFVRRGYLADMQSGVTVVDNRDHRPDDVTLPYLRVVNVQDGRLDLIDEDIDAKLRDLESQIQKLMGEVMG